MTQEKSDYYNLKRELYRMYHRRIYLVVFLSVGIILGILSIIYGPKNNLPIISTVISTLFVAFLVFLSSHYHILLG